LTTLVACGRPQSWTYGSHRYSQGAAVVILWSGVIYQTAINANEEGGVEPAGAQPVAADDVAAGERRTETRLLR
jgi:hypothetical protein